VEYTPNSVVRRGLPEVKAKSMDSLPGPLLVRRLRLARFGLDEGTLLLDVGFATGTLAVQAGREFVFGGEAIVRNGGLAATVPSSKEHLGGNFRFGGVCRVVCLFVQIPAPCALVEKGPDVVARRAIKIFGQMTFNQCLYHWDSLVG
jgi:hypothetical protein